MLKLLGLGSCLKSLENYGDAMTGKVWRAVDEKAEDVMGDMADMAPWASGAMSGSIGWVIQTDTATKYIVRVGPSDDLKSGIPELPYPVLVEFGSGRGAAQPFMRPATERNKPLKI